VGRYSLKPRDGEIEKLYCWSREEAKNIYKEVDLREILAP
jgi:hypothetical protein